MNLEPLIEQVEKEYRIKSIAPTRFNALRKVYHFLTTLENAGKSAIDFLQKTEKADCKDKYLHFKQKGADHTVTLSGAENQAINDLYRNLKNLTDLQPLSSKKPEDILPTPHKILSTTTSTGDTKHGLPPMVGTDPKVLILGTLPSDVSIQKQAYYRNESRNSFWKIMECLLSDDSHTTYEDLLKKNHIALWDCVQQGKRKGSTDKGFDMNSLVPNDLEGFLRNHPTIQLIVLNGKSQSSQSTYSLFHRFFESLNGKYKVMALHSTSNANANLSLEGKIEEWSVIKEFI